MQSEWPARFGERPAYGDKRVSDSTGRPIASGCSHTTKRMNAWPRTQADERPRESTPAGGPPRGILGSTVWNLATRHGLLDISFAPSAFPTGYAELSQRAEQRRAAGTGLTVSVAPLDDIHRSKRAANRLKDQAYFRSSPTQPHSPDRS